MDALAQKCGVNAISKWRDYVRDFRMWPKDPHSAVRHERVRVELAEKAGKMQVVQFLRNLYHFRNDVAM